MIGAMPAVAVRHERRKQEKRTKRPNQLYLGGLGLKRASPTSHGSSPTPSPLQSPPVDSHDDPGGPPDFYICGKVSVLHVVVVSLLMGAILLIVGLVQLTPGADASDHRYYLLGDGGFLMLLGIVLTFARCCLFPWHAARYRRQQSLRMRRDDSGVASQPASDKSAQVELRNGGLLGAKVTTPSPAAAYGGGGGGGDEEEALVSPNTSSSVTTGRAGSTSHSGDALHSIATTASPSEHDALIRGSSGTLDRAPAT